ncbi:Peroxisomal biogenesis factor 6 [Cyberlindnera fabianii]|uniref:Peroxisomal ATPase PEX6 n=1 Tax=Cyberlindnera fabianii TaxID=36022 RepID=A0A1V2L028_CYBFA|nr:Peroxisomal biogenesis factor 6 [Cyberlindnera fabianii]
MTVSDSLDAPQLVSCAFADDITTTRQVRLSSDLLSTISSHYVAVKPISELSTRFLVYPVSRDAIPGNQAILIDDSSRFGVESTADRAFLCSVPKLVPLTKMIVAFPKESYDLLKQYSGNELLSVLGDKMGLDVIHEGDRIGGKGHVLLCEPIDQGQLTQDTVVTLVKDTQSTIDFQDKNEDEDADMELDVSRYLTLSSSTTIPSEKSFKINAVSSHKNIITVPQFQQGDDEEYVIYATPEDLTSIGVFSGDFVEATLNDQVKTMKILALAEPNTHPKGTIQISPITLINLGYPTTITLRRTTATFSSIPIAQSLTVSRIASPMTLSKVYEPCFLANLKLYFESATRLVSLGDLIAIPFDSVLARSLPQGHDGPIPSGNVDSVAWFRVSKLNDDVYGDDKKSGGQFIVDPSHLSLSVFGVLSETIPGLDKYDWRGYLGLEKNFNFASVDTNAFEYTQELQKLLKAGSLNSKLRTTVLLTSLSRNVGKSFILTHLCQRMGLHLATVEAYDVLNASSESKTLGAIRGKLDRIVDECSGVVVFIKHIDGLVPKPADQGAKPSMMSAKVIQMMEDYTKSGAIIVASTIEADKLAEPVRSKFRFEVEVPVPSENDRKRIFEYLLPTGSSDFSIRDDVSISSLALQSAGLTPRDLKSIVETTKSIALDRLEDTADELNIDTSLLILQNPIKLTPSDFERAIGDARNKFSDSIGAPRIPNVLWDDIGGLESVKGEILDTIDMPLKHPELFASGVKKRSGILFYGPPGTGKTLLAKAIATNFSLNFFSVKGPELLNMYIGESEANVRKVFQRARDAKPCVVFFDELDSVAPKRGNQGDSGGVMDRIVSQLLAELDGMSGGDAGDGVFVVGATNRPDLLDEALLRPGRFDKMVYLGIADTHLKQQRILEALTRKFKLDPNVDLERVAQTCPYNFTGADFYALCSDSMLNAMTRVAGDVDRKLAEYNKDRIEDPVSTRWWFDNVATKDDIDVLVTEADFEKARRELTPSVSAEELQHYLRVRDNFEGGKVQQKQ